MIVYLKYNFLNNNATYKMFINKGLHEDLYLTIFGSHTYNHTKNGRNPCKYPDQKPKMLILFSILVYKFNFNYLN